MYFANAFLAKRKSFFMYERCCCCFFYSRTFVSLIRFLFYFYVLLLCHHSSDLSLNGRWAHTLIAHATHPMFTISTIFSFWCIYHTHGSPITVSILSNFCCEHIFSLFTRKSNMWLWLNVFFLLWNEKKKKNRETWFVFFSLCFLSIALDLSVQIKNAIPYRT